MAKKREQEFSSKDEEKEDIYLPEGEEEQLEEDEITGEEANFMEGYGTPKLVECASCRKKVDFEKVVEKEINGTNYWFCSKKCADLFEKRKAFD